MTEREDPIEPMIRLLKEPAELAPGFTERVMAEVERLPAPGITGAAGPWWRRSWTVRLSPLRALSLAAGVAALMLAARFLRPGTSVSPPPVPVATAGQLTQFVLVAPEASAVHLVGDFNDWSTAATPLVRAEGDGMWHVTVPLVPGRYRYAFVVDGRLWRPDPEAPALEDEFGRANSVVTVGGS
ncbi:MAG: isoamylase early set domain-containing protein [Gemmatimonadales bacterium]